MPTDPQSTKPTLNTSAPKPLTEAPDTNLVVSRDHPLAALANEPPMAALPEHRGLENWAVEVTATARSATLILRETVGGAVLRFAANRKSSPERYEAMLRLRLSVQRTEMMEQIWADAEAEHGGER